MNNFDDLFEQQPQKEAAPQKPEGQKERPKRQWWQIREEKQRKEAYASLDKIFGAFAEGKGYDIARLNNVFKGQDPRVDVPAALSDMRETFKSLNGRMARAMGLTRDTKQKEPER